MNINHLGKVILNSFCDILKSGITISFLGNSDIWAPFARRTSREQRISCQLEGTMEVCVCWQAPNKGGFTWGLGWNLHGNRNLQPVIFKVCCTSHPGLSCQGAASDPAGLESGAEIIKPPGSSEDPLLYVKLGARQALSRKGNEEQSWNEAYRIFFIMQTGDLLQLGDSWSLFKISVITNIICIIVRENLLKIFKQLSK